MASTILAPVRPCNLFTRLTKCNNLAVLKMGLSAAQTQTDEETVKIRPTRRNIFPGLAEVNQYNLFEPGFKVLQIGTVKNSWSQLLVQETNATGKVKGMPVGMVISIGADGLKQVEGVHDLSNLDFMPVASQDKIIQVLGRENKFDLILSDWMPKPCGVKRYDNMRMAKMVFCVYFFLVKHLRKGGNCLLNVEGVQTNSLVRKSAQELFKKVHLVNVTEGTSTSSFLLGKELCLKTA